MQHTALVAKTKNMIMNIILCCPFCGRVSIIMLQKVAAIVNKVAADLCFTCPKARCLLGNFFFTIAASSAASLYKWHVWIQYFSHLLHRYF